MRTAVDDDLEGGGEGPGPDAAAVEEVEGLGGTAEGARRLPSWAGDAALLAAVVVGLVARFVQRSPLWLDEALSVNIARLPVGDLLDALRHDGHPPLYYLLLHGWMDLVGESDAAVRALSGAFSVAALPLAWIAGRRLAGRSGARWSLAVAALSPYLVRYATETRMYSLVMLLVLAGYLLLADALHRPTRSRLGGLAVVSGLLLLSHYWSFYLLAAVGLVLVARAWRRPAERAATVPVVLAVAAGGVLFLPWIGGFLYQSGHTGTPWGEPFRPTVMVQTMLADMGGGAVGEANLYASAVVVLVLVALFAARSPWPSLRLDLRTVPGVRWELAVVALVLAIGTLAGYATDATFQGRYAATVVPLVLLAVAVGITKVPSPARAVVALAYGGLSLFGVGWINHVERTQSDEVAAAVAEQAGPGDVVVYCPDQLGPAYSREMPEGLVEVAYPTLDRPDRVDWVDYADRNAAADPGRVAQEVLATAAGHAVFVVWAPGYDTFESQCQDLVNALGAGRTLVEQDGAHHYEPATLSVRPAARGPAGPVG
ncbi:MAG TPA: glycosyltransferase family 39 protein [Acidimicrobiales bacterium]|nr:glycosyltransferase family 39 protein [Acidimicrobiales bacterium]